MSPVASDNEDSVVPVTSAIFIVVVSMVLLRGVLSMLMDIKKVLRLFAAQYKDKRSQTEPYFPKLPDEVFLRSKSDVYHVAGCTYAGEGSKVRRACCYCANSVRM